MRHERCPHCGQESDLDLELDCTYNLGPVLKEALQGTDLADAGFNGFNGVKGSDARPMLYAAHIAMHDPRNWVRFEPFVPRPGRGTFGVALRVIRKMLIAASEHPDGVFHVV